MCWTNNCKSNVGKPNKQKQTTMKQLCGKHKLQQQRTHEQTLIGIAIRNSAAAAAAADAAVAAVALAPVAASAVAAVAAAAAFSTLNMNMQQPQQQTNDLSSQAPDPCAWPAELRQTCAG